MDRRPTRREFLAASLAAAAGCARAVGDAKETDAPGLWLEEFSGREARPPIRGDENADVVIVGAGFTGLSTACHASLLNKGRDLLVIEAERAGAGASGRSSGAVSAEPHALARLAESEGPERLARRVALARRQFGSLPVFARITDANLQLDAVAALRLAADEGQAAKLKALFALHAKHDYESDWIDAGPLREAIGTTRYLGALRTRHDRTLNPARVVEALARAGASRGVRLAEGTPALAIREADGGVVVETPRGVVRAKQAVLATNAYSSALGFFADRMIPLHLSVLATRPLTEDEKTRWGWDRFPVRFETGLIPHTARLTPDGRVFFRGVHGPAPRDRAASPDAFEATEFLRARFVERYPYAEALEIEKRWIGRIAYVLGDAHAVGRAGPSGKILYSVGYGGYGILPALHAGKMLADALGDRENEYADLFEDVDRYPWLPEGALRDAAVSTLVGAGNRWDL